MKSVPFKYLILSIIEEIFLEEKLMWLRAGIDNIELIKGTLQHGKFYGKQAFFNYVSIAVL
jgi:hypothetical protein